MNKTFTFDRQLTREEFAALLREMQAEAALTPEPYSLPFGFPCPAGCLCEVCRASLQDV